MTKKIFSIGLSGIIGLTLFVNFASAQKAFEDAKNNLGKVGVKTGLVLEANKDDADIYTRLASYLNVVLGLVGIIAAIYIIFAGIRWIRAGGNEQTVTEAKDTIKSAVYGLIVVFGSYAIVNFVVLKLIGSIKLDR